MKISAARQRCSLVSQTDRVPLHLEQGAFSIFRNILVLLLLVAVLGVVIVLSAWQEREGPSAAGEDQDTSTSSERGGEVDVYSSDLVDDVGACEIYFSHRRSGEGGWAHRQYLNIQFRPYEDATTVFVKETGDPITPENERERRDIQVIFTKANGSTVYLGPYPASFDQAGSERRAFFTLENSGTTLLDQFAASRSVKFNDGGVTRYDVQLRDPATGIERLKTCAYNRPVD